MNKTLSEIVEGKEIVINNDFDGILCGYFLKKVYNCIVVGYTNSKDKVFWNQSLTDKEKVVYIDCPVTRHTAIDQHILVEYNDNVLNPNIERGMYAFSNYVRKFPFSTFLYILAKAAGEGKDISPYIRNLTLGNNDSGFRYTDIILRADDILMITRCNYPDNANDWWNWMIGISNSNPSLIALRNFIASTNEEEVREWRKNIDSFFCKRYCFKKEELCEFGDKDETFIKPFLSRFGLEDTINFIDIEKKLLCRTKFTTKEEFDGFMSRTNVFSYAVVYSPYSKNGKENFSFTIE